MNALATKTSTQSLDEIVDQSGIDATSVAELLSVADALADQPRLRQALTNPGMAGPQRAALTKQLLAGKLNAAVTEVVAGAAQLDWNEPTELADALEQQAVRLSLVGDDDQHLAAQLFAVQSLLDQDHQLAETLSDELSSVAARRELLAKLLDGKVDTAVSKVAQQAINPAEHGVQRMMTRLAKYVEAAVLASGSLPARVISAAALTDAQHDELKAQLTRIYGQPVKLLSRVDSTLLGGVRVEIGDEVIDGTIRAKLDTARRKLNEED